MALRDTKVWLYGLGYHTMSLSLYTPSLFPPTIIKEMGFAATQAQLLTVPPHAVATTLTFTVALLSERFKLRAPFIMGSVALTVSVYFILLAEKKPGIAYLGTILAAGGIYPAVAIVLSWPANNVSGRAKRATANAMQMLIGNLGTVSGSQLYRATDRPRYVLGHGFELDYLCAKILAVGTLWATLREESCRRDNGERDARLVGVGDDEWLGDEDPKWTFQT